jgi:hypothetical protein
MGHLGKVRAGCLWLGARALAAAVELHYLSASLDVFFERIQRRGLEKAPIERDAMSRWFEIFQAPTPEEMALFDKPLVMVLVSAESNPLGDERAIRRASGKSSRGSLVGDR